jgi:hypothetical protein
MFYIIIILLFAQAIFALVDLKKRDNKDFSKNRSELETNKVSKPRKSKQQINKPPKRPDN